MEEFMKWAAMLLAILAPLLTGIGILWKKLDKIWQSINRMDRKKVSQKQCEKRRAQCCAASKKKKGYYMKQSFILIAALAGVFFLAGCGHNMSTYSDGLGLETTFRPDSGNFGLVLRYGKIWSFVARENTDAEMTGANSLDAEGNPLKSNTEGNVKISVGPQTTGYEKEIVLALKDSPEAIKAYYQAKSDAHTRWTGRKRKSGDSGKETEGKEASGAGEAKAVPSAVPETDSSATGDGK